MKKSFFITVVLILLFISDVYGATLTQLGYRWRSDGGTEISALYMEEKNLPTKVEQQHYYL